MTKTVNVHDAKTHLSKLLADVEAGDEVMIARRGQTGGEDGPRTERRSVPPSAR